MSSSLEQILARIESRLADLGIKPTTACRMAGKPDAIRNIKKAIKAGSQSGITSTTIEALARVLETTPGWLMTGSGAPEGKPKRFEAAHASDFELDPHWEETEPNEWLWTLIEASYLNLGLDRDESYALVRSVRAAFEDPHVRPGGLEQARRELVRRLLKSKAI